MWCYCFYETPLKYIVEQNQSIDILKKIYSDTEDLDKEQMAYILKNDDIQIALFNLIIKHRLSTMAYNRFLKWGVWGDLLRCVRDQLIAMKTYQMQRFLEYEKVFTEINECFNLERIQYANIKGLSISDRLYEDKSEREFNDLDFLVSKEDLGKVERMLERKGYCQNVLDKSLTKWIPISREELIYWRISSHQIASFHKSNDYTDLSIFNTVNIDINYSIFFGGKVKDPIDTHKILQHSDKRFYNGMTQYMALDDTYSFLQLCISLYKDTKYKVKKGSGESLKLINVMDIYRYASLSIVDFNSLYEIANKACIVNELIAVFSIVKHYYKDFELLLGNKWLLK